MGIDTIICEYIYGSFLIIKSTIESVLNIADKALKALDAFVTSMIYTIRFMCLVALEVVVSTIKILQQYLVEMIPFLSHGNIKNSKLCSNLFECKYFINQLLNPNSVIYRLYRNIGGSMSSELTGTMNTLYKMVNDFDDFKEQVCNFGFTFNFGLSAINALVAWCKKEIRKWHLWLLRKKTAIRNRLQSYIDLLYDLGVMGMLDDLQAFFKCALADIDACNNIESTKNFYSDSMSKLKLQNDGSGHYKFNDEVADGYYSFVTSVMRDVNTCNAKLEKIGKQLANPTDANRANKAFNLASVFVPKDAVKFSWKKGFQFEDGVNWSNLYKEIPAVKYTVRNFADIYDAIVNYSNPNDNVVYDPMFILNGLSFNSNGDYVYVNPQGNEIDLSSLSNGEYVETNVMYAPLDTDLSMLNESMLGPNGEVIPVAYGTELILLDPESNFSKNAAEGFNLLNGMTLESETLKQI